MKNNKNCKDCGSLTWWLTLTIAVIAVPCVGIIAALMWGSKGIGEVLVFVIACWLCTYLGMKLMNNPKMSQPVNLKDLDKK